MPDPIQRATLTLAATLALASSAHAFNPQPDPPARIGLVSLTAAQTLRLNVRVARLVVASNSDVIATPCRVSLGFVDGEGRAVGHSTIGLLRLGQGTRLDLPGAGMVAEGHALMVHSVVRVLPAVQSGVPAVQSCAVATTVEVLDRAGNVVSVLADPLLVTADSAEQ